MTYTELKYILENEHKRDQKLTIINFLLIAIFLCAFAYFLYYFGRDSILQGFENIFAQGAPTYYKFAVPIVVLGMLFYPIFIVFKLLKRPEQIASLIQKLENGATANLIHVNQEHKIKIPVLKVNVHLFPMEMMHVNLNGEIDSYIFPVPYEHLAAVKSVLSGADVSAINAIKDQLYDDDSTTETHQIDELKSVESFSSFIASDLQSDLNSLESDRVSNKKIYMVFIAIAILAVVGWGGYNLYSFSISPSISINADNVDEYVEAQTARSYKMIGIFVVLSVLVMSASFIMRKLFGTTVNESGETGFKNNIFKKLIAYINPDFLYSQHGHIDLNDFLDAGLFKVNGYNISGNDLIVGKHSGVPFQFSDLYVSHTPRLSNEKDAPETVFYGQFFIAKFNKQFTTPVFLTPRKKTRFGFSTDYIAQLDQFGDKVQLEDVAFMDMYDVYSTDQVEARYILSTSMMECIKELTKRTKGKYYIAFNNNRIFVGNYTNEDKFEAGYFTSLVKNDNALLKGFYQDLCDQLAVINELKLNLNIWKK